MSPAEYEAWAAEVRQLADERGAVVLAHNYQVPEIQDVAHFTGDSLYLSRGAAEADARRGAGGAVEGAGGVVFVWGSSSFWARDRQDPLAGQDGAAARPRG